MPCLRTSLWTKRVISPPRRESSRIITQQAFSHSLGGKRSFAQAACGVALMQLGGAEERREMVQRRFPCAGGELFELAVSAAVVSAVVIMARFVWMYPEVSSALAVSR